MVVTTDPAPPEVPLPDMPPLVELPDMPPVVELPLEDDPPEVELLPLMPVPAPILPVDDGAVVVMVMPALLVVVMRPAPPAAAPEEAFAEADALEAALLAAVMAPLDPAAPLRAARMDGQHDWSVSGGSWRSRTGTEGGADGDDGRLVDAGRARLVSAVMHAATEVGVGAQAGDVVRGAAQARGLHQHVVDACFLDLPSAHGLSEIGLLPLPAEVDGWSHTPQAGRAWMALRS